MNSGLMGTYYSNTLILILHKIMHASYYIHFYDVCDSKSQ